MANADNGKMAQDEKISVPIGTKLDLPTTVHKANTYEARDEPESRRPRIG